MFDVLAMMGAAAIGEIIKQSVSGAVNWAKGRKKPSREVVDQKIEQIVSNATRKVVADSLSSEDRQRIVSGLVDVVRPTLDQVMEYSPNTQRIFRAAGGSPVRRGITAKKSTAGKILAKRTAGKEFSARKSVNKRT